MHTHITRYRLLAGVLLLLLLPVVSPAQRAVSAGQRAASPGQPAFAAKDYAAFLAHLPGEAAAPTPRIVATCVPLMRDHGYELAAHCLGTIADDLPGKRVIAWARIPPEKQPPVDAAIQQRFGRVNTRMMAEVALQYYVGQPPRGGEASAFAGVVADYQERVPNAKPRERDSPAVEW